MSSDLRARLTSLVALELSPTPDLVTHGERRRDGYLERAVSYAGREGPVPALTLVPDDPSGVGTVVHHQHNGQWHLGKSRAPTGRTAPPTHWCTLAPPAAMRSRRSASKAIVDWVVARTGA